jgi:hypothetical protein
MTEWKIEEPKGNKKDVVRRCQSRMKFMFHVLKGNLAFDVSEEFRHIRVKVKNNSKKSSNQDEENQEPFHIMNSPATIRLMRIPLPPIRLSPVAMCPKTNPPIEADSKGRVIAVMKSQRCQRMMR